jgi:hypothetical protein
MVAAQLVVAQPPFHHAGAHALDQHVGLRDQAPRQRHAGIAFRSMQTPAFLLRFSAWNSAPSVPTQPGPRAAKVASGRLHLDHLGAHVGQQHGAGGAGSDLAEIEDLQVLQCIPQHGLSSPLRA